MGQHCGFHGVLCDTKTIDSNGLKNVSHQVQSDDAERLKSLLHFLLSSLSMGWPYEGCGLGFKVP